MNFDLKLEGKKEFYNNINNKTYFILKVDNQQKENYMYNKFITFSNNLKANPNEKHYIGIDFEFNKVSKDNKDVALMQINLENDSKFGYIFLLYPPKLKNINRLIELVSNPNLIKILHGSESLDIPYLFNQLLIKKELIDNFCNNFYDTRFLCDYDLINNKDESRSCSIYKLLLNYNIVTEEKINELNKVEERMGPIYNIVIDVNNLSKELLIYALYDVIYLPELLKKFMTKNITYTKIIPELTCLVNKYKRNIENEFNDLKEIIDKMNIYYIDNKKLFYKLWESDYSNFNNNLKEINYFKKFFEIITKMFFYKKLFDNNVVYKKKDIIVNHVNFDKYINWLKDYKYVYEIFI